MFDAQPNSNAAARLPQAALRDLREYVGSHRESLLDAAILLGGGAGLRVAQAAIDGLQVPGTPSRRTMRELERLLGLLMLENTHHPGTVECERFEMLEPTDPCVEEICLLADELSDHLKSYREVTRTASKIGRRAAA
jgi:hypothetical protein